MNVAQTQESSASTSVTSSSSTTAASSNLNTPKVPEDSIDVQLWKESTYSSDSSKKSMKISDLSSNPWDPSYLESKGIKTPAFHAYMRKMLSGIDKGKFASLEHQQ